MLRVGRFYEAIDELREPGESDRSLAKRLGINSSRTLSAWKQGSAPRTSTVYMMVEKLRPFYTTEKLQEIKEKLTAAAFKSGQDMYESYPHGLPFNPAEVRVMPQFNSVADVTNFEKASSQFIISIEALEHLACNPDDVVVVISELECLPVINKGDFIIVDLTQTTPMNDQVFICLERKKTIVIAVAKMSATSIVFFASDQNILIYPQDVEVIGRVACTLKALKGK